MVNISSSHHGDPFDLNRFLTAQDHSYERALSEIKGGRKRTHWMWYIFPQIAGLGYSATSAYYAIKSRGEAVEYLQHPVLGARLREIAAAAVSAAENAGLSARDIFAEPDDLKLQSCATLFAAVSEPDSDTLSQLDHLLTTFFQGERDTRTLALLKVEE